jgi:hypothetical protein
MHRYLDAVISLSIERPDVNHAFLQVSHLVAPPRVLFRPSIALRALPRMLNPRAAFGISKILSG